MKPAMRLPLVNLQVKEHAEMGTKSQITVITFPTQLRLFWANSSHRVDLEVAAFPSIDLEHRLFSTKAALLYFDKEDHSLTSRSSLCSSCSAVIGDRLLQRDSVTSPRKAKDWVVVAPSRGYWNPTPR